MAKQCPRCKGAGQIRTLSFNEPRKERDTTCSVCKGKGVLPPDLEVENAALRARVAEMRTALYAATLPHAAECGVQQFNPCNCGAEAHNAAIDAAIKESP